MCGMPRSGTTLVCAALHQPPVSVTSMEPWDGLVLPPADLFRRIRSGLRTDGTIPGRLDLDALARDRTARWGDDLPRKVVPEVDPNAVHIGVKWPSYWQLIDRLPTTKFLVCVRRPDEVISSFVGARGALRDGLDYDVPFHADLNQQLRSATRSRAERRAHLYRLVAESVLKYERAPNVLVVRYERWFDDADALLSEIGRFLGFALGSPPVVIGSRRADPNLRLTRRDRIAIDRICGDVASELGYRAA